MRRNENHYGLFDLSLLCFGKLPRLQEFGPKYLVANIADFGLDILISLIFGDIFNINAMIVEIYHRAEVGLFIDKLVVFCFL